MIVKNSKGEVMKLNTMEQKVADYLQRIVNELPMGFNVDVTTLTTVIKRVSEQKFFELPPADYIPIRVGEGAWSDQLTTFRSFQMGDEFEKGIVNAGADSSRLASTDAGVDSVSVPVRNWAKQIGWSLFDLQQAMKSGNWDIVTAKEKARKRNWDLGIQGVAFLGLKGVTTSPGLLNQGTDVTKNVTLIAKPLSSMTSAELSGFLAGLLEAYRSNCNRTAQPSHFIVPEDDYNGLATPSSIDFPIKSRLQLIEETMKTMTRKAFQVLPCAYAMPANSSGKLLKPRYTLLNYDEESIRMDIPVDYTSTLANTINNFSFQNVGYGQFTGVGVYRALEILYLDNNT